MARLQALDQDPERIQWFESRPENYVHLTSEELIEFSQHGDDHLLFAVAGSEQHPTLDKSEVGEVQGWVKLNPDAEMRVSQLREQHIIPSDQPAENIWEVSYTKLEGAQEKQMASGLRQSLIAVSQLDAARTNNQVLEPQITVAAYVIDGNTRSEQVLLASGFEEKGRIQYDDEASQPDRLFILNWDKLTEAMQKAAYDELKEPA
ncbi:MAG TPA: hypothetical protein VF272_00865 [Candidatus Saccharimonadia bacterium]